MLKMLNSGSAEPVTLRHSLFTNPALGPASITHANAPRKGGVTNEAMTRPGSGRGPARPSAR